MPCTSSPAAPRWARASRPCSRRSPRTRCGVDPRIVQVTAGDTAAQPFGAGILGVAARPWWAAAPCTRPRPRSGNGRSQLAARILEAAEEDLDLADGFVSVRGDPAGADPGRHRPGGRPASRYLRPGEPPACPPAAGFEVSHMTYPYGAHAAVVEVDPAPGRSGCCATWCLRGRPRDQPDAGRGTAERRRGPGDAAARCSRSSATTSRPAAGDHVHRVPDADRGGGPRRRRAAVARTLRRRGIRSA